MSRILDRVEISNGKFRPTNSAEFFALQLARKLNDAPQVTSYANLVSRLPQRSLLTAFHRAKRRASNGDLAGLFRQEITGLQDRGTLQ
jgi:hypothetical protein